MRNDANPALRDKDGYNAVHYASSYGHRICLELVSKHTHSEENTFIHKHTHTQNKTHTKKSGLLCV